MKPRLDLFVFSDALGWELSQRYGFARDWLPNRMPCRTLLGYSCTCDPTILTGCYPDEHLHFSFFVAAKNSQSPFAQFRWLGWLPHKIAGYHRIRNRISRYFARHKGYTGYFQLYSVPFNRLPYLDYTEKKDIYEPGGIIGGQPSFFQDWEKSGLKWMRSDWRCKDTVNLKRLEEALSIGKVELAYLFTSGLDALMHRHGTTGDIVQEAFAAFDQRLQEIISGAEKNYREINVYLFSDHGMTDVVQTSNMLPEWEKLGLWYGKDYIAAWDSTMARFWFMKDSARELAIDWLSGQSVGDILTEETLRAERCWFEDHRYGELFFLLKPGVLVVPSYMNMGFVTGMHGYSPEHRDSTAAFLTNASEARVSELKDLNQLMKGIAHR